MTTEKLFTVLSAIHPLTDEFKIAIEKELTLVSFPKQYLLLEAPKIAAHAYFLNDGFAMCYTFVDGEKQIEGFWKTSEIIVSARSFFEQVPAMEFIELLVPSEVLCISYQSVMRLFDSYPEANFIYRVVMNQYYEQSRQVIRDLQHLNAVERYEKLLTTFPNIEQIISQEQIASYLGITPQSLSRIKRR
jgi:CRP-like cAMP-binding protein